MGFKWIAPTPDCEIVRWSCWIQSGASWIRMNQLGMVARKWCPSVCSNYAPTMYIQKIAERRQCQQVLWLHLGAGGEHFLTEVGTMNLFLFWQNEQGGISSSCVSLFTLFPLSSFYITFQFFFLSSYSLLYLREMWKIDCRSSYKKTKYSKD